MKTILKKGTIVTLLTSYCGWGTNDCTDVAPCPECIKMCNTFELDEAVSSEYKGEVGKSNEY